MLILSIAALPCNAIGDGYLWPLKTSSDLSSGFCQWRSGHFHSGIDVRTHGKTGYKVRAIADGYAWRVVTRWYGYGKALYLKLDDGRVAVFGHLLKFTPEIDRYVQEQQLATKRYDTDLYPLENKFRFKKGDVIAYTGQSGVGAPHLHFEIRTKDQQPLNPLTFYPELADVSAPSISSITLRPLSPVLSRIDGVCEPVTKKLTLKNGRYSSDSAITIYGPVGLEVESVDKRPGTKRSYAISRIELYIDSIATPLFVTAYDTISFERWGDVNLELNYSHALAGNRFMHNLYILPGCERPIVNDVARNRGWIEATDNTHGIDLSPGNHKLLIRVFDQSGNTATAEMRISLKEIPEIARIHAIEQLGYRHDTADQQLEVSVFYPSSGTFRTTIADSTLPVFLDYLAGNATLISQFRDLSGKLILLTSKSDDGARFDLLARMSETGMPIFSPVRMVPPSCLEISTVKSWYDPVKLDMDRLIDAWDRHTESSASLCLAVPVLFDRSDLSLSVAPEIVGGSGMIDIEYGRPFAVGSADSSRVVVRFPNGHLVVDSTDFNSRIPMTLDTATATVDGMGKTTAVVVSPDDLVLNDWVELMLKLPGSGPSDRVAVYKLSEDGQPSYIGGEPEGNSAIRAKLSKTGSYALIRDTISPTISNLSPADGGTVRKKRPKIKFKMDDELSGIENDTSVSITVDGVWAIPEYDVESKWMVTYSSQNLKPGKHTIEIRIRDRAGNETTRISSFRYTK